MTKLEKDLRTLRVWTKFKKALWNEDKTTYEQYNKIWKLNDPADIGCYIIFSNTIEGSLFWQDIRGKIYKLNN